MKKLTLLAIGAYVLIACDATPKGNKVILPVEHDEAVEKVDLSEHEGHGHDHHAAEHAEPAAEVKDTVNQQATPEVKAEEAKTEEAKAQ